MPACRTFFFVALLPFAALAQKQDLPLEHSEGAHFDEHEGPLGADLARGWFEAPGHSDFNRRGTAYVDMQILETPYMCHLLRTNVAALRTEEGRELEISAEIEWAFTRRILLAAELPYVWVDPHEEPKTEGFADFALGARFLLLEFDRFVLALNVEAALPTGRRSAELSAEEVVIEPSLLAWFDLGANFTLNIQAGFERGVESDETEALYRAALAWSCRTRGEPADDEHTGEALARHGHDLHGSRAGLLSVRAEFSSRTSVEGAEEGLTIAAALLGLTWSPHDRFDVRAGYLFPVTQPRELNHGWLFGATLHF